VVSQTVIARELNVSQRTVSLCLAGSNRVAARTRERVLEAARRLGYQPNRSARAMRSGRFNAVALLQSVSNQYSDLPGKLLGGIQDYLMRREMHLVIASVPDAKLADEDFLPTVLREWSVDGFLVNYCYGFSPRIAEVVGESRLPSVWLNVKRPHDCVYPDDIGGAHAATRRLLSLGHTRIAFYSARPFEEHYSVGDRFEGYVRAMREAGRQPRKLYLHERDWTQPEAGLQYVRSFLEPDDRPTAVLTYESFEAMRVLMLAWKLGLEVPRDLSIVTFHPDHLREAGYPVATMIVPEPQVAQVALDTLTQRIESRDAFLPPQAIPYGEMVNGTVGPPPA
jgi:LacI family transcriptional regulator